MKLQGQSSDGCSTWASSRSSLHHISKAAMYSKKNSRKTGLPNMLKTDTVASGPLNTEKDAQCTKGERKSVSRQDHQIHVPLWALKKIMHDWEATQHKTQHCFYFNFEAIRAWRSQFGMLYNAGSNSSFVNGLLRNKWLRCISTAFPSTQQVHIGLCYIQPILR